MVRHRRQAAISGFLNVHKPKGITSHQCVAIVRKIFNTTEVGHAGTLDPMATGVIVAAVGCATKFLQYLPSDKEYHGVIQYGTTTTSDDITGNILTKRPAPWLREKTVRDTLSNFVGTINQVPPKVSALKRDGKRLYELVRTNMSFEVQPRPAHVRSLKLLSFHPGEYPEAAIHVICGAGTYVRSIARESGECITLPSTCSDLTDDRSTQYVGATLKALKRTRSGIFSIDTSLDFDEIRDLVSSGQNPLCPIEVGVKHLPLILLKHAEVDMWRNGSKVLIRLENIEFLGMSPFDEKMMLDGMTLRVYGPSSRQFLGVSRLQCSGKDSNRTLTLGKRTFIRHNT